MRVCLALAVAVVVTLFWRFGALGALIGVFVFLLAAPQVLVMRHRMRLSRALPWKTARLTISAPRSRSDIEDILSTTDASAGESTGSSRSDIVRQTVPRHLIARDNEARLVGKFKIAPDGADGTAVLVRIWVAEQCRRQGYATEILDTLLDHVGPRVARLALEVPIEFTGSAAPLARRGFEPVGEYPILQLDGQLTRVVRYEHFPHRSLHRRVWAYRHVMRLFTATRRLGAAPLPFGLVRGERIVIRQVTRLDARAVCDAMDRRSLGTPSSTVQFRIHRALVRRTITRGRVKAMLVVLDASEQTIIGVVELSSTNSNRNSWCFGMWIAPTHRRQGYGSEALATMMPRLGELDVRLLTCALAPSNSDLGRVLEHLGFTEVGYRPGRASTDGTPRCPVYQRRLDNTMQVTSA